MRISTKEKKKKKIKYEGSKMTILKREKIKIKTNPNFMSQKYILISCYQHMWAPKF